MKRALGRGLDALIPETVGVRGREILEISISRIRPGRYQPRFDFDMEKQRELIDSIKEKGVVQPIIVRPLNGDYELIAGERRLRAARELGVEKVPVVVREVDDEQALELAIVENVQREDLNPIEEAKAYSRLSQDFGLTQEEIAQRVGKNRVTVTNIMRLLKLPEDIQSDIASGRVTAGHAKVILMLDDEKLRSKLRDQIVKYLISVREAERYVERLKSPPAHRRRSKLHKSADLERVEESLRAALGTQVRIMPGRRKGRIEIEYYSQEDLERILELIAPQSVI